jgi:NADH-quinone oxidoreductase subunit J
MGSDSLLLDVLLLGLTLLAACGTVFARSLLRAAISLGATSVFLALLMFRLDAPMAAVFELSVCAGLITVIFASAVSLMKLPDAAQVTEAGHERTRRYLPLLALLLLVGLVLAFLGLPATVPALPALPAQPAAGLGATLWGARQVDLLGLILILLVGAFGVVVFFKSRERRHG